MHNASLSFLTVASPGVGAHLGPVHCFLAGQTTGSHHRAELPAQEPGSLLCLWVEEKRGELPVVGSGEVPRYTVLCGCPSFNQSDLTCSICSWL